MTMAEVNKNQISPQDWYMIGDRFPMPIRFMLPYYIRAKCIHVADPNDLYHRVGGFANNRVTQILLSKLERMMSTILAYLCTSKLMDEGYMGVLP